MTASGLHQLNTIDKAVLARPDLDWVGSDVVMWSKVRSEHETADTAFGELTLIQVKTQPIHHPSTILTWLRSAVARYQLRSPREFWRFFNDLGGAAAAGPVVHRELLIPQFSASGSGKSHLLAWLLDDISDGKAIWSDDCNGLVLSSSEIDEIWEHIFEVYARRKTPISASAVLQHFLGLLVGAISKVIRTRHHSANIGESRNTTRERVLRFAIWSGTPPPLGSPNSRQWTPGRCTNSGRGSYESLCRWPHRSGLPDRVW